MLLCKEIIKARKLPKGSLMKRKTQRKANGNISLNIFKNMRRIFEELNLLLATDEAYKKE